MPATTQLSTDDLILIARRAASRWRRHLSRDDAQQVAYVAILGALESYDPARGAPEGAWLAMHAKWAITRAEQREARHRGVERLDEPLTQHGESLTLLEVLAGPDAGGCAAIDAAEDLEVLFSTSGLTGLERGILEATRLREMTLSDAAADFQITSGRARDLRDSALKKLRRAALRSAA